MMQNNPNTLQILHFEQALLPSGWAMNVAIEVDGSGNILSVNVGRESKNRISGCLVPGIVNLHSHAHQRAMAGLTERAGHNTDSFWTWRKQMYNFLNVIEPQHLQAIAAQLYVEMLKVGYTHVAEFQYLHHQSNGERFDNIAEMSLQTLSAALEVGIGITNLPVLYQYSGFGAKEAKEQQCRFVNGTDDYLKIVESVIDESRGYETVNTGIAAHSLRAVTKESFKEVLDSWSMGFGSPVHIHIAEQLKEVEECVSLCGTTPVEYLFDHFPVDESWCLIHATHMNEKELKTVANSGAVVGICPTTEANLGDGVFNATGYIESGGLFGIGSDSHISISPIEELRWLEYSQRLRYHSRNLLSGSVNKNTGSNLLALATKGGAKACAQNSGRIEVGQRADFIVLQADHALLYERFRNEIIDSWIFSGNQNTVRDVYVGGQQVIKNGQHEKQESIEIEYRKTLKALRALQ